MFELQEWQLVLVGFVASVLVQLIRFAGEKLGQPVGKTVIQWLVFALSLGFGLWFGAFTFPPLPAFGGPESLAGIVDFIGALVVLAGQLLGVAYVIYNVILKKVFDAIEPLRI